MATIEANAPRPHQSSAFVIGASSLGTIFEWYEFYFYGLLATIISTQFFSGVDETSGFMIAFAVFAAGVAVWSFRELTSSMAAVPEPSEGDNSPNINSR